MRDPRLEIRDPRSEIQDPRFEIRDSRFEIQDLRSEIEIPDSRFRISGVCQSHCHRRFGSWAGFAALQGGEVQWSVVTVTDSGACTCSKHGRPRFASLNFSLHRMVYLSLLPHTTQTTQQHKSNSNPEARRLPTLTEDDPSQSQARNVVSLRLNMIE